jgi:hypothetical protein
VAGQLATQVARVGVVAGVVQLVVQFTVRNGVPFEGQARLRVALATLELLQVLQRRVNGGVLAVGVVVHAVDLVLGRG